jgi:hypothetical protein
MSGVDYWIYGHSAYEIELFHHTKTRAIFAMADRDHKLAKAIAWYMFSATLAKKVQSEFAKADWMDPKSEAPFAHHDVPVGPHHPFAKSIGLDQLNIDAKRDKDFLYFDLRVKTKANGLVRFPFWMGRDATPKVANVDITGRLYLLEPAGPFSPGKFRRGPQSNAAISAIIGPVM